MPNIAKIIEAIDDYLDKKHQNTTTPVEVLPYLESIGLLNDSPSRPGLPLRKILRDGRIPHAYQIEVKWFIPHSSEIPKNQKSIQNLKSVKEIRSKTSTSSNGHKLRTIGDLIVKLIEVKYKKSPTCYYEYKPEWLPSYPTIQLIDKYSELSDIYSKLVDNELILKEQICKLSNQNLNQMQSFDIWIGEPFNFAIEFDEKQHFNQYRKITLDYYERICTKFPLKFYKKLNKDTIIKPGTSGFTRLKSNDPLFPELLIGKRQDNRIRQRAFRDFLKDLLPNENGFNPTLRIPFHITNNNIDNFSEADLRNVEKYIEENELI
jgi:hypothetical protein